MEAENNIILTETILLYFLLHLVKGRQEEKADGAGDELEEVSSDGGSNTVCTQNCVCHSSWVNQKSLSLPFIKNILKINFTSILN